MPTHSQIAEAKAHIEVLQAFIEGKTIVNMVLSSNGGGWLSKTTTPEWNFGLLKYLVAKPKPPEFDQSICPQWFAGYAMDRDGRWYLYHSKPEIVHGNEWRAKLPNNSRTCSIPAEHSPQFYGDWKDSWVANPNYKGPTEAQP